MNTVIELRSLESDTLLKTYVVNSDIEIDHEKGRLYIIGSNYRWAFKKIDCNHTDRHYTIYAQEIKLFENEVPLGWCKGKIKTKKEEQLKVLVIPDVHGTHNWEIAKSKINEVDHVVFLGDYF